MNAFKNKIAGRPLPVVFFTILIDLLGFGILIPVIPQLLANPHSAFYLLPAGWTVKQGYILLGFLTAIYPFMQFISTPILGQLSDRYGRKPILAISLLGTSLSYVLFAIGIMTKNLPLLFIARAFDGITGGNLSVAQAAIADITTPENRAKNFGLIGAAFGLGFIMGPYLGGKLSSPGVPFISLGSLHLLNTPAWFNAATPFWFAALLSFLNVCSVLLIFPETLTKVAKGLTIHWNKSLSNINRAFKLPGLRVSFISIFLFTAGFTFFTTFASVYFVSKFNFTASNVGDYFSYVGVWIALSQAVVTRKVSKVLSEHQVLRFSFIATGLGLLLYFIANARWELFLIAPFFAMFNGLTMANSMALVSRSAGQEIQGEILGISASVQALAQSIPPVLSGYIAASLTPSMPILFAGSTIIIAGVVFITWYKAPKNLVATKAEPALPSH